MCRRFTLVRDEHDSVNQPGVVAEGVVFGSGKVAFCWCQHPHSTTIFDSLADVLTVQKQNAITRLNWLDPRDTPAAPAGAPKRPSRGRLEAAQATLGAMLGPDHVLVRQESTREMRLDYARSTAEELSGEFVLPGVKSKD